MNLNIIKSDIIFVLSFVGGLLSFILGGFDRILITLVCFSVFDYITGVLSAIYHQKLSSYKGSKGIIKKIGIFILVSIGELLEQGIGIPALREIIIMFFIANEGISILENLVEIGLPIPSNLKKVLADIITKYEDEKVENFKEDLKIEIKEDLKDVKRN